LRIIDLTLPLNETYRDFHPPRHPDFEMEVFSRLETHHRYNSKIAMSIHTGSHVEGPNHALEDGASIDQIPLDRFMGDAVRLDLRHCGSMSEVDAGALKAAMNGNGLGGKIAVLDTGWMEAAPDRNAFFMSGPVLTEDAAKWLVEQEIRSLVVDFEIDRLTEQSPTYEDFAVHRILLGSGIPLIEFVHNLHLLPESGFRIVALPLPIAGGDGSPVRAVGVIE